ncbi:MAG: prepilin-type N-terminal cleavage/methylation domain-containing protein [Sulfurovum sp.]|nr:prepilin-type N-terminal cleavage/methylation domain-containing protein [Sulfurovum sp.]
MKSAFTMVELVFAIVIIGILASVAIPKLAATRDDAQIVSARTAVAALRSAISTERQKRILGGNFDAILASEAEDLLGYGLPAGWERIGENFIFTGPSNDTCIFTINTNRFVKDDANCTMVGMSDL